MNKKIVVVGKRSFSHDGPLHDWFVKRIYLGWFGTKFGWAPNIIKTKTVYLVRFLNP